MTRPAAPAWEPGSLFARARRTDPETSHEAAASITHRRINRSESLVSMVLRGLGEGTDLQIEQAARLRGSDDTPQRLRSARAKLVEFGLAEWTGEHGLSPTGKRARIWRVTK